MRMLPGRRSAGSRSLKAFLAAAGRLFRQQVFESLSRRRQAPVQAGVLQHPVAASQTLPTIQDQVGQGTVDAPKTGATSRARYCHAPACKLRVSQCRPLSTPQNKQSTLLPRAGLHAARVPVQAFAHAAEPVARGVVGADRRDGPLRHADDDGITRIELLTVLTVKRAPHHSARILRNLDAQLHVVWEDKRAERQRVWADGCEQDARHLRVQHGATCCQVVGGGACRRRHDEAVPLHVRDKVAVAKRLEVGEERRSPSVNHDLIEHHVLV
mmetsp:Transcript_6245/g.19301  ORF Transcript_6245/g.19301 Transcript_6245/m.19301 type:complete len:270 (+) Transcript_6245:516-1325(+)